MGAERDWLAEMSVRKRTLSAPNFLLNSVMRLASQSATLLDLRYSGYGDVPTAPGNTAVALELAVAYQEFGFDCTYFDWDGAIKKHRLKNYGGKIYKPSSLEDVYDVIEQQLGEKNVYIVDYPETLLRSSELYSNLESLLFRLTKLDSNGTFVFTGKPAVEDCWTQILSGVVLKNKLDKDRSIVGHLLRIDGPLGSKEVYIDYKTGRIAHGYELALKLKSQGQQTYFTFEDIKVKGFWEFVSAYRDKYELV